MVFIIFLRIIIIFFQVHHIDYVTSDMIKTKITHNSISTNVSNPTSTQNDSVPVSNTLPTTGRPVLMTPKGPISMRNMRKEPTQEELVSFSPPFWWKLTIFLADFQSRFRKDIRNFTKMFRREKIRHYQSHTRAKNVNLLIGLDKNSKNISKSIWRSKIKETVSNVQNVAIVSVR